MAKAKARTKKAPFKAAKKLVRKPPKKVATKVAKKAIGKTATVVARPTKSAVGNRRAKKAPSAEVRLPLTTPVRVAPAPRPRPQAQRLPMPVSVERPIGRVQLRQPSLFQRELPPHDGKK